MRFYHSNTGTVTDIDGDIVICHRLELSTQFIFNLNQFSVYIQCESYIRLTSPIYASDGYLWGNWPFFGEKSEKTRSKASPLVHRGVGLSLAKSHENDSQDRQGEHP